MIRWVQFHTKQEGAHRSSPFDLMLSMALQVSKDQAEAETRGGEFKVKIWILAF